MNKFFKAIVTAIGVFSFATTVYAGALSVKIEQPKSPTNLNNLKVNFVVLDQGGTDPIVARCYWSKNGGGVSQLGSDIAISAGGNTADCVASSSVINEDATYHFYVTADNGGGPVSSPTVDVVYDTSGPGTPNSYSKEDVSSCSYKIKFHTADDGLTTKVELYRSQDTSFSVDASSKIESQNIGPNLEGSFTTNKPDCTKTYYYAIRAFDSIGNGSGVVGDEVIHTITTSGASGTAGAQSGAAGGALAAGTAGNVLGQSTGATGGQAAGPTGSTLGATTTPAANVQTYTPPATNSDMMKKGLLVGGGLGLLLLAFVLRRKQHGA